MLLGTWSLDATATVTIISLGGGSTCADAAKLECVQTSPPPPPPAPPARVLDNGDEGTSCVGHWPVSGGASPYGADSLYAVATRATYSFRFDDLTAGEYRVYLWWTTCSSRLTDVPVDVIHSAGTSRVAVNQQKDGGRWMLLGTWSLDATATVTVNSLGRGSTCADAARVEFATPRDLSFEAQQATARFGKLPAAGGQVPGSALRTQGVGPSRPSVTPR
jgi:hypothetical protein